MHRRLLVVALVITVTLLPTAALASQGPDEAACWGQATKVFAGTGAMGEHASGQETPRVGLRNLARALHDQGVLPDDSLAALGAFVAAELGLTVDACSVP